MKTTNIEESKWTSKEGYECSVVKTSLGHRCGYVKVPSSHPTTEIDSYDDVPVLVHGGLTYGANGKWGFDCAHSEDTPQIWTLAAVKNETEKLAEQLSLLTWMDIIKKKLDYMPKWFQQRITIKETNA